MNLKHVGSDFDDFLREEQVLETTQGATIKRVIAFEVEQEMSRKGISKTEMASRMKTSRATLKRLLDPANTSVTLTTLGRAASALGRQQRLEFVDPAPRRAQTVAAARSQAKPQVRSKAERRVAKPKTPKQ